MSQSEPARASVDLARSGDFDLGGVRVRPSACRIEGAAGGERLEPRVMEVLVVLARADGGTVTRDQLIEACWQGRAVSDDAVSRTIAKLRALARAFDPEPWTLETLPKVGFRLVPAMTEAATAFTAPWEPVPQPPSDFPPPPAPLRPSFPVRRAAAGLGLLAGLVATGAAAWWMVERSGEAGSGGLGQVEMRPFATASADPAVRRLSMAISETTVRELRRGGVETTVGAGEDARLRVEGTLDVDGGRRVLRVQVLGERGAVLWSDRQMGDDGPSAGFEARAASRIADVLQCGLSSAAIDRRPAPDPVLGLFLEGCAVRRATDEAEAAEYVEVTGRLVALAPERSGAHSQHARALAVQTFLTASSGAEVAGARAGVKAAADRALALNPRNGEAHFAIGISQGEGRRWREREASLERAAALSPRPSEVWNYQVGLLREVGRLDEANALNARAVASDPFSPLEMRKLAVGRADEGDVATAERLLRRLEQVQPEFAAETRTAIAFWGRDPAGALAAVRAAPRGTRWAADRSCYEAYLVRLGQAGMAPPRGLPDACGADGDYRMRMLARQGDIDGAYAVLDAAPDAPLSTAVLFRPEMERFRADRRFMPLAARLGLVDYWLATGRWPDFCTAADRPYDCAAAARAATVG